jgi:DNA-binding MarR family transcriptional regulator
MAKPSKSVVDAWIALNRAQRYVFETIEAELKSAGLPPLAWYDVLWAIGRAPGRRIRMAELASSLTVSRGGLTKLADRLESAGLIRREAAEDDRRGLYAVVTPAGEQMLKRMWPVYAKVLRERFVAPIRAEEAAVIADALSRR